MTRAIFIEFAFYNPNVNLFSTGTLIVEFLSTGAAVHYQSINVKMILFRIMLKSVLVVHILKAF